MKEKITQRDRNYKLPCEAFLRGKGRVRVLHYLGQGQFMVLTKRDERVSVHRNRLRFTS